MPRTLPNILLVDDDAYSLAFYGEALRNAGFRVTEANDGASALRSAENERPDLIITDLRMPGIDGMTIVTAIRDSATLRDVPVLLLSGAHDAESRADCFERGADDFLSKPIDTFELVARARRQLRKSQQVSQLRSAALVDDLTGVFNRRGVMMALERELARAQRSEKSLAVLLVDVDEFKQINDTHGHAEGDRVLREIVEAIGTAVRGADVVGRLGGDEFVVILPEVGRADLETIVARIRAAVANVEIGQHRASVSIGSTIQSQPRVSSTMFLECADQAMYREKRAGRRGHLRAI